MRELLAEEDVEPSALPEAGREGGYGGVPAPPDERVGGMVGDGRVGDRRGTRGAV